MVIVYCERGAECMGSIGYLVSYTVTFSVFFTSYSLIYYLQKGVKKLGSHATQFWAQTVFRGVLQTDFNTVAYGEFVQWRRTTTRDNNFFCKLQDRQIIHYW